VADIDSMLADSTYECQARLYEKNEMVIELGGGESCQMEVQRLVYPISIDTNSAAFVGAKIGAIELISTRTEEVMAWQWGPAASELVLQNARKRSERHGCENVIFEDFEDSSIRLDPEVWSIILYLDPNSSFDNGVRLDEARRRAVELIRKTGGIAKHYPESGAIPLGDGLGVTPKMATVRVAANVPTLSLVDTSKIAEMFGTDFGFVPKVSIFVALYHVRSISFRPICINTLD